MSSCTGAGGEDFTFEVFADETARDNFLATKQQLLCTQAEKQEIDFPGFPYVEGSVWLIEPDEAGSANAASPTLVTVYVQVTLRPSIVHCQPLPAAICTAGAVTARRTVTGP